MKRGSHTGCDCRPAPGRCQGPEGTNSNCSSSEQSRLVRWRRQSPDSPPQDLLLTDRPSSQHSLGSPLRRHDTWNWGACPGHTMVLQPSERHNRDWSHGRLGPWCSPTGSPAPLSCETGCGEGSWILVCRLLVPTQVSLLSMEEDIDTRKINNSFLRDHSYATEDKTVKLWKVSERDKRPEGYNLKDEEGRLRDPATITTLRVPVLRPMDLMVEATPRRVFANAHTYHINSISVNSDYETYMSADDLRINLWNFEITNQSFNIVDIKPANMEELTEVITAAEFHPHHCNTFVYSSSKGTIRLCDMRASALCDRHTKFFEEPEDPSNRSFFSEIISSISDVKFSHSGRYIMTRDYLTVKVWDLNMENRPIETYQVHDYLRSKLCSLYENDCIFDKFECVWNGSDSVIMTGSYNNFFRMFDRNTKRDVTLEASRENSKPRAILKPRKVCVGGKRRKDEISVDSLDFSKKILHTAWHPSENIIAVAATNNLYIFQDKVN
uniref:Serine/threonine-protein phosphatase 2A 55 kDa regulatory subunit B n=2 Tax=Felidae TaxID=9681 RepID=A0ABI7YWA9_FELCA